MHGANLPSQLVWPRRSANRQELPERGTPAADAVAEGPLHAHVRWRVQAACHRCGTSSDGAEFCSAGCRPHSWLRTGSQKLQRRP